MWFPVIILSEYDIIPRGIRRTDYIMRSDGLVLSAQSAVSKLLLKFHTEDWLRIQNYAVNWCKFVNLIHNDDAIFNTIILLMPDVD